LKVKHTAKSEDFELLTLLQSYRLAGGRQPQLARRRPSLPWRPRRRKFLRCRNLEFLPTDR
jgi:hypothetical protein